MYGKLVDSDLIIAPKKIIINDTQVWNAPSEEYIARGWFPVIFIDAPEAQEGFHYESGWEQADDTIIETWTLVEDEVTTEEILDIILGGAE